MNNQILLKYSIALIACFTSILSYASSIEGYWRSIDDRTDE